jgi:hypothetical protein
MASKLNELCAKIEPPRHTGAGEGAVAFPKAMALEALRDARQLTQVQLARLLSVSQGAVSKAERRTDMFVSTLRSYVRAIGGDLQIRAVFPEGEVLIDQFKDLNSGADLAPEGAVNDRNDRPPSIAAAD